MHFFYCVTLRIIHIHIAVYRMSSIKIIGSRQFFIFFTISKQKRKSQQTRNEFDCTTVLKRDKNDEHFSITTDPCPPTE